MPLQRRLPKFGFKNINRVEYKAINLGLCSPNWPKPASFRKSASKNSAQQVTPSRRPGEDPRRRSIAKALEIEANAFSAAAKAAIEAAGGTAKNLIMRFIETLKNIWTIQELRQRLLMTLLLVLIYRLGCYVVLPGIIPDAIDALANFTNSSGLMQLLDMFSGSAFSQASIFALGIMPYITASIVIQLCGMILPSFQKMQSEGESGRQKMNQYTATSPCLFWSFRAPAYLINLQVQVNGASNGAIHSLGLLDCGLSHHNPCRRLHVHHVAR